MADKKDAQKEFSTCFEKLPFAEMMKKIVEQQEDDCGFDCAETMRKMMKECSKV